MNAPGIIVRTCACAPGCDKKFTVNPRRPGQQYFYGHKPATVARLTRWSAPPAPKAAQNPERHLLDYRLARKTAGAELELLDRQIEAVDDEMEALRKHIAEAQARKDEIVSRHGRIRKAHLFLSAVIDNVDAPADE